MQVSIKPSAVKGVITAPASKSAMQRACAAALVKGGQTIIKNPGISNDDKAALDIIAQLGARVTEKEDTMVIESNGVQLKNSNIHCGESGLSIRMFTPIAALSNKEILITGEGSLAKRPMDFFSEVLPQLGVQFHADGGKIPLKVKGPLQPKNITVDGSLSSQYLTGLLLAYAAADANDVTIHVTNLASKPYVDLTMGFLKSFGLKAPQNKDYKAFYFDNSTINNAGETVEYFVEGDWSGAAFLLVAGAVAGDVTVKGLLPHSTQADKAIMEALRSCGANIEAKPESIRVQKTALKSFEFDATDCPDLFPPLVALAASCHGISTIHGVNRLAHKESNRGLTLQEEFGKMGITVDLNGNEMRVHGCNIKNAQVHSHHDHRIAMACAIAALNADGAVTINDAQAVNKSYPAFWDHLAQLQKTA